MKSASLICRWVYKWVVGGREDRCMVGVETLLICNVKQKLILLNTFPNWLKIHPDTAKNAS